MSLQQFRNIPVLFSFSNSVNGDKSFFFVSVITSWMNSIDNGYFKDVYGVNVR